MKNFTNKQKKSKKKLAFTLAEILITIGLIGIVAALTLPILSRNIQARVLKTRFDKHYAELSHAVEKMQVQNDYVSFATYPSIDAYVEAFNSKFGNNVTICDNETETDRCGSASIHRFKDLASGNLLDHIHGWADFWNTNSLSRIVFPDNAILYLVKYENNNTPYFIIDINGLKEPPNRFGYDVFIFYINIDKNIVEPLNSYNADHTYKAVTDSNYFKDVVKRIKL